MSLFESFATFGLFDAENCKKVDYFTANKPQIMQTLFVCYLWLFATIICYQIIPITQAIKKKNAMKGPNFRK